MHAVITGDIVNSTLIQPEEEQAILQALTSILAPDKHEFFRGDSFQAFVEDPLRALRVSLLCRTAAKIAAPEDAPVQADIRISIGLGDVNKPVTQLATAKGEAFILSGRALDAMDKTGGKIIISCENKLASLALTVLADYINSIFGQITHKQAEVLHQLLSGLNQQQVAEKLNRSKSTISQHVTAGKWDELEALLEHYNKVVQLISS
jgi:hypothetical protein